MKKNEAVNTPVQDENTPYVIETDPQYNIPTEELLKLFPVTYQTPAATKMEQNVQNRMLNGFNRWNMGYAAWEHWGEVLYYDDSIYNVHGVRLTLQEYQKAMNMSLKATDIQMGDFQNMILCGDWMAIRYDTVNIDRRTGRKTPASVMEFARFKDFGEKGAKVEEGWGGVKQATFPFMSSFQTKEEQAAQQAFMQALAETELPDTDNLEEKYPVCYPTPIETELGKKMKAAVLQDFENWNRGYEAWSSWADELYAEGAVYTYKGQKLTISQLREVMKPNIASVRRVRINNILVSENWTAVHYWDVTALDDGTKDVANHMQFLRFAEDGDGVKVDLCWAC